MNHIIEYENLKKLNEPFFEEYKSSFASVLNSGKFILGKQVDKFEEAFAAFCGSKYCASLASGLDALILSLRSLKLPKGAEVIVPSNTYIATILSILHCELIPVLIEPDLSTYNISPSKILESLSSKTKAIMVVHLYGKMCEMDSINQISKDYQLYIVEDCAQAHGAQFKGITAGNFGIVNAFSFYPTKNLGALGDGGAITTDHQEIYENIKTLRNYGSNEKYYNEIIGINSRLDELQATFLSIKLKSLRKINEHKRKLAKIYLEHLDESFIKPVVKNEYYDVYHIFNIRIKNRDELRANLSDNNINTEIHYPIPPHRQKAIKELFIGKQFPISEEIHKTTLSLPISYFHSENDIFKVVEVMNKFASTKIKPEKTFISASSVEGSR